MTDYWFARSRVNPLGKGLMVLKWQGAAVIAGFVLSFLIGGIIHVLLSVFAHQYALGMAIWVICIVAGGCTFIWAATNKSDPNRTAGDYRAERAGGRSN
jgi:hypothetical protein